jgi:hypothetical protein
VLDSSGKAAGAFGEAPGRGLPRWLGDDYRLRRLVEPAGIDLADPVERLVPHLHSHLRDGHAGRTAPAQLGPKDDE